MDAPSPNYTGAGYDGRGVVQPDPSKAAVFFFSKAKEMPADSQREGVSVWRNVDYVRVQQPGERDAVTIEATAVHKARWPKQWEDYQAGKKSVPEGTLVSILFPGNEAQVMMLQTLGIFTIEQLAAMADSATGNIPFGGDLKKKAQSYLDTQNGAKGFNQLQAQLNDKDERIRSLEMQLTDLNNKFRELDTDREGGGLSAATVQEMINAAVAAKRGPGRPPKEN